MTTTHVEEPDLPDGITPGELDDEARRDLRGLQKDTADVVAKHLVAAGMLVDEDPEQALAHARYARRRASRIAVVREAAGIVAYHAGEWNEALGELRAARRMGGGPGHLAVMADIERALGRPERALELVRAPEAKELGKAETIELAIVAAGARRDLGEFNAAVVGLQIPELEPTRREPWSPRLFYAYADNLLAAGRESDALQWFVHTVNADADGETDAAERIAELTGEALDDDGVTFQGEDEVDAEPGAVEPGPDGAVADEVEVEPDDEAAVSEIDSDELVDVADIDEEPTRTLAGDTGAVSDADAVRDVATVTDTDVASDTDVATDADATSEIDAGTDAASDTDVVGVDVASDADVVGDADVASDTGVTSDTGTGGDGVVVDLGSEAAGDRPAGEDGAGDR